MTTESILKMEKWNAIGGGRLSSPRELAKARAGAPFFKEFYLIGENAKDTLRRLISDDNEDIRRSSTLLLQQWPYLQGGMKQSYIDLAKSLTQSLTIPLLEEALLNPDAEVRYHACCALGDLSDFDNALETLYRSVSKMQLLRDDSVIEVRGIAYTASGRILRIVSEKAMDPEIRFQARKDNEKHSGQPRW
jgi:HEAT repeat protein